MMGYGFGGYGGYGLGWIGMLIPFLIIIGVVYLITKGIHSDKYQSKYQSEAILRERFARGEISEEEYDQMKKVLRK